MDESNRRRLRNDIMGCLNSIRLSTEVVRASPNPEEATEFLGYIGAELSKIERLIKDLIEPAPSPPSRKSISGTYFC